MNMKKLLQKTMKGWRLDFLKRKLGRQFLIPMLMVLQDQMGFRFYFTSTSET